MIKISKKKLVLITSGALIAAIVGFGVYSQTKDKADGPQSEVSSQDEEAINFSPPSEEEKRAGEQNPTSKTNPPDTSPTTQSSGEVLISKLWQDSNNHEVIIQTKLLGSGWNKCYLTLSRNNSRISESAGVLYQEEFSTCMGFSLSASRFPSAGQWKVSLKATKNNGSSQTAETKVINVDK